MARVLKATDPKAAKPSKPKILIFGESGSGKTWFSLDFPAAVYIDCEYGASRAHYTDKLKKSGGVYLGPDQGANDFAAVTEEIITLATTKHPYKTLIIDSFSKIFNSQVAADHERMEKAGRDMEKTFGAEKKGAINWTRRWLRWFEKLDMNVILTAHQKDKYQDGKLVGATFDGHDKLLYELDLCLQTVKAGASRRVRVVKSRLLSFPDSEMFDLSYDEFAKRYGKEVIEGEVEAVALATDEQIKRFNDLLAVVKVDQKVLEKWEENGEPNDLTSDDLQKRIDFLVKLMPKVGGA